jgi:tetratricopeptide repeat protein 8
MLLDENATSSVARPGTSLSTPQVSSKSGGGYDQGLRPVSQSGRPVTGFSRPMSSRPMSGSTNVRDALQSSNRNTAARPMTNLGREVRLGTASLQSSGALVDVERLNIKKYASRAGLAMVLTDYLLFVEHNTRKALGIYLLSFYLFLYVTSISIYQSNYLYLSNSLFKSLFNSYCFLLHFSIIFFIAFSIYLSIYLSRVMC